MKDEIANKRHNKISQEIEGSTIGLYSWCKNTKIWAESDTIDGIWVQFTPVFEIGILLHLSPK